MKKLVGHTSPETAYVVDDYPYGFKVRTKIRYWIENNVKKGKRFCTQTLNPKTGVWNAPKLSVYAPYMVMILDENNHVQMRSISLYANAGTVELFKSQYEEE